MSDIHKFPRARQEGDGSEPSRERKIVSDMEKPAWQAVALSEVLFDLLSNKDGVCSRNAKLYVVHLLEERLKVIQEDWNRAHPESAR